MSSPMQLDVPSSLTKGSARAALSREAQFEARRGELGSSLPRSRTSSVADDMNAPLLGTGSGAAGVPADMSFDSFNALRRRTASAAPPVEEGLLASALRRASVALLGEVQTPDMPISPSPMVQVGSLNHHSSILNVAFHDAVSTVGAGRAYVGRSSMLPSELGGDLHDLNRHDEAKQQAPKTREEMERLLEEPISSDDLKRHPNKTKIKRDMKDLKQEILMDDHQIPVEELLARLNTDQKQGLVPRAAAEALNVSGRNKLSTPPVTPNWLLWVRQMITGFSLLLWAGTVLCLVSYILESDTMHDLYLAIALSMTIILTGTFAYVQEKKSGEVMAGFRNLLPQSVQVIRGGHRMDVDCETLVPGDIVEILAGNKIAADMRVLEASSLSVDNSSLTGESEPQERSTKTTHDNPMETKNLLYCGTTVVNGSGIGVVIFTGDNTLIGRIAGLALGTEEEQTPIQREINRFVLIISLVALVIGVLFFVIGLDVHPFLQNLVSTIGIIVANVPEGLIATVTVCLTHAAKNMAARNVLVKNLQSVETLGSTGVICSDKTGTLTTNRMSVRHSFFDGRIWCANDTVAEADALYLGEDGEGVPSVIDRHGKTFTPLQKIIALCNCASFSMEEGADRLPLEERPCLGSATEIGLLRFAEATASVEQMRVQNPKIVELPFNSTNKYQLSIHAHSEGPLELVMKGAPERILDRCSTVLMDGDIVPLTDELRAQIEKGNEVLASRGERVLGFCRLDLDNTTYTSDYTFDLDELNFPTTELCFVGLVSLIDPPRSTVPGAVAKCHTAGIKVIMVTGDHPLTAKAISKQIGIIKGSTLKDLAKQRGVDVASIDPREASAIVVTGSEIPKFSNDDWDRVLAHEEIVFARTSPQQKLLIVEANQDRGSIVAVTGDGVNDSPALKKAHIGIAMGITGSDVSKETADMILLDDNFASIVAGIEEGRLIFDNLKKSIAYTLEHLLPEIMPIGAFFIFEIPLPLTTVLILCIDLGTDIFPAIALSYEQAENDIMTRPPRNPLTERLVGWRLFFFSYLQIGIIQTIGVFATYFAAFHSVGFKPHELFNTAEQWDDENVYLNGFSKEQRDEKLRHVQTAVFLSVVIVQYGGLLVCKTRKLSLFTQGMKNRAINLSLMVETILAVLLVYVPAMNDVLGTAPIAAHLWLPSVPFALAVVLYDELRKRAIRRNPTGCVAKLTYY